MTSVSIPNIQRRFALVGRNIEGFCPMMRMSDMYPDFKKAKWEWLEYQAMRFRASLGLDALTQVEEVYTVEGTDRWVDAKGEQITIEKDKGEEEKLAA